MLPGLPIAADGETFDEALDEMVAALREYSQDWTDHLRHASNHQQNWGLVQIIDLSSDEELHALAAAVTDYPRADAERPPELLP